MACLPQLGSVPVAYAVVAGGCDWPLPPAVGLSNNDVVALRPLRQFRQFHLQRYKHSSRNFLRCCRGDSTARKTRRT